MQTVFSYIIQKRLSQVNEDVATDALAYVLESSDAARHGMMKLLRGIAPDLPSLRFKTQQTKDSIRPDMWGYADNEPRVFVENKFWAGLTDNQPVSYLKQLATYSQPTVLLVVAPATREQTLWRELNRRLLAAEISTSERDAAAGVARSVDTQLGPILALTSWTNVLSVLEHESVNDPGARGDLVQLRALCDAADISAFSPISPEELTDQRTPSFMLELSSVMEEVIDKGVANKILNLHRTKPQASSERVGRYAKFGQRVKTQQLPGVWLGIHFRLWKKHGTTPLWVVFQDSGWGKARVVQTILEPWASREGIFATRDDDGSFVVALDLPAQEEKARVVEALVIRLEKMFHCLVSLEASTGSAESNE